MKFAIISGTHRVKGRSLQVADVVLKQLKEKNHEAQIVDLSESKLPQWHESIWDRNAKENEEWDGTWKQVWDPIAGLLRSCDGLVVITPEYGGMVPAALKNFFLFLTGDIVAHKPAMIVAVSAGRGGSYPIAELRMSSYKNSRLLYIPDQMIFAPADAAMADEKILKRLSYTLDVLAEYARALRGVRESGVINLKDYPSGI